MLREEETAICQELLPTTTGLENRKNTDASSSTAQFVQIFMHGEVSAHLVALLSQSGLPEALATSTLATSHLQICSSEY